MNHKTPVILHIIDNFNPGGAQNILINLIRNTHKHFQHKILILNSSKQSYLSQIPKEIEIFFFNIRLFNSIPELIRIKRTVQKLMPELISFNLEFSYFLYFFMTKIHEKCRITFAIHAIPAQLPWYIFPFIALMNSKVHSYTVEDTIAKKALLLRNVPSNKIHHIPIGTEIFEKMDNTKAVPNRESLTKKNIDFACPIYLNIARMVKGKGHLLLVDVFYQYTVKGGKGKLVIVGYGPLEKQIRKKINDLNLGQFVEMVGKTTELQPLYKKADFYISCATEEGMGVVIFDAMAMGLPILGFDAGSISEVVHSSENGILTPVGDINKLAKAMIEMESDKVNSTQISWHNQYKIFDQYRNSEIANMYAHLYHSLLSEN